MDGFKISRFTSVRHRFIFDTARGTISNCKNLKKFLYTCKSFNEFLLSHRNQVVF